MSENTKPSFSFGVTNYEINTDFYTYDSNFNTNYEIEKAKYGLDYGPRRRIKILFFV